LVVIRPGQSIHISRSGRLYGEPERIRVDCLQDYTLRWVNVEKEEADAKAASALQAL
jgi:hypothetical protein